MIRALGDADLDGKEKRERKEKHQGKRRR